MAWSGLRERGHQARPAGGQVLPGLARGFAADSGSAFIVAGYLLAILPNELGASRARAAGLLAPRVRAVERALVAVALPAILIMVGVDVVWYSATTSSVFWMSWGLVWFLTQGQRAIGEIRRGRTG